ncbi:bifunctional oligoribonuclease/PAP phosphatase NrnA [Limisphaera ngatamarikiensis]|uniref:Bifunctional oligoribonuclease/PAP phosphatase NrnA n=1 Tax=Limisphaera ngatamarikiensis TaxID=1324935 RepID=A0A6M1RPZ9_9BACT|nr:bifunctional oligoribonuclease/PAP phosphatase NrnA [Limisphaera ngatamarikiensis]
MRTVPRVVARILEVLREAQRICVVGHVRPDGDCIGSQLALALALEAQGRQVTCWNEDAVPEKYRFLDPEGRIQKPHPGETFDCVVATDSASLERLGPGVLAGITERRCLINIDHHVSNTRYGDINWVVPRQPSTGELIHRLLRAARWPITPPIADCLFTAISTDTGSFQYPTTLPSTYHVAGELVARGANLARICHEVYQSFPLTRVRLLKRVYSRFRLTANDQIAYCWISRADIARSGANPADTEGLIDHLRAIEPVVVACLFEEYEPGVVRVSLRSKSDQVDVGAVAAQFGGGGHPAAAGARIPGTPLSVRRRVLAALKKALLNHQPGPQKKSPCLTRAA